MAVVKQAEWSSDPRQSLGILRQPKSLELSTFGAPPYKIGAAHRPIMMGRGWEGLELEAIGSCCRWRALKSPDRTQILGTAKMIVYIMLKRVDSDYPFCLSGT